MYPALALQPQIYSQSFHKIVKGCLVCSIWLMINISEILGFSFRTRDTTMFWIMVLNTRILTLILFSKCSYFAQVYIVTLWISTIAFEFLLHRLRIHIQSHSLSEENRESVASSFTFLFITDLGMPGTSHLLEAHPKIIFARWIFSWESCFATPAIKLIIA